MRTTNQTQETHNSKDLVRIKELEAMLDKEWQPIKTAPMEKEILCYHAGKKMAGNYGARIAGCIVDYQIDRCGKNLFQKEYPESKYTRWQHLPETPKGDTL